MRLILDLRAAALPVRAPSADERIFILPEFAGMIRRRPREAMRLFRRRRLDVVRIHRDEASLAAIQSAAICVISFAWTRRFEIHCDDEVATYRPLRFRLHAFSSFAWSFVEEPVVLAGNLLVSSLSLRRPYRERRLAREPQALTFVRAESSLSWLGQKVGGVATHTTGLVNGFTDQGLDVRLFAAEQPDSVDPGRTTIVPLERQFHIVPWLTTFAFSRPLVRAAENVPADFIYQHHAMGSHAGLTLARKRGVPLVLGFHASDVWSEKHYGSGKVPLESAASRFERATVARADLLVVISHQVRDLLVDWGVDAARILVNPSGVDVERFERYRAETPAAWRERLGREQAPTVGFVGTFGLWHGVRELPPIIEATAGSRPDARWVLIGNGSMYDEVADAIAARGLSEAVHMPGMVTHEQALELLASCDITVSPHVPNADGSRFVGSPTKLFEYMGLGKPIVASDLEQIGEVLEHERTALLHAPGDAEAAAAEVVRLLDDRALAQRLGAAALAEAQERYSWVAHTRRILDALVARAALGPHK